MWRHDGPIWGRRWTSGSCARQGPHSEDASWQPWWACPAGLSPPDPSASASSSGPLRRTLGTVFRYAGVPPCNQNASGSAGGWEPVKDKEHEWNMSNITHSHLMQKDLYNEQLLQYQNSSPLLFRGHFFSSLENHYKSQNVLTSASSSSVTFLSMSPGKVTNTELSGRHHAPKAYVPKRRRANTLDLMLRPRSDLPSTKEVSAQKLDAQWNRKNKQFTGGILLEGLLKWSLEFLVQFCRVAAVDCIYAIHETLVTSPRPFLSLISPPPLARVACLELSWSRGGNFQNINIQLQISQCEYMACYWFVEMSKQTCTKHVSAILKS